MKANFLNTHNDKVYGQKMQRLRQEGHNSNVLSDKNNITRPAEAISFGGSALSLTEKFIESQPVNKLVGFVNENEAAYTAIYSLVIAGILKPMVVLAQTGHDDKDGQMIATKNFLQAFLGSFLSLTVGGGFIKRIYDNIKSNIKLFEVDENDNLKTLDATSTHAKNTAKKLISKSHNTFSNKLEQAKEFANEANGAKKIKAFVKGFSEKIDYKPTEEEVASKAKEFVSNFNQNHKEIFEKNPDYLKRLVKSLKEMENNPMSAKRIIKEKGKELKKGCQDFEAFESFWKNSTGAATSILKAKISSFLLPTVMAFMFAKRNLENETKKNEEKSIKSSSVLLNNSQALKDTKNKFSQVSGGAKTDDNVAFKGLLDSALEKSTRAIESAAMSAPGEKCVNALSRFKKPSARMADLESIGITAYWVGSTTMSKRIDPDQKLGLNVHSILVTAVSSTAALIIDALTDGAVDKVEETYLEKIKTAAQTASNKLKEGVSMDEIKKIIKKDTAKLFNSDEIVKKLANKENLAKIDIDPKEFNNMLENLACKYSKHLFKFKSLTIFTLVVRFLVPTFTVKISKKIKNKIIEWTKNRRLEKEAKAKQEQAKTSNSKTPELKAPEPKVTAQAKKA